MRRPLSSKSYTCTEGMHVDAAGISGKVARLTLGDLSICLALPPSRGDGKDRQKSAEVVGAELTTRQRTEPVDES